MNEHSYILEPYKGMNTRYSCPKCNKGKTFSLYINTETNEHLHNTVGRCNRESSCGYHYTPKQYFSDNKFLFDTPQKTKAAKYQTIVSPKEIKPISFIPVEIFTASLKNYDANHFVKFLIGLFGVGKASEAISRYFIATSKHWNGATVFWQIDIKRRIRTGKIMLYSPITGKRIKEPFNHIAWAHKLIKQPEYELRQCLFGEHLLINKTKPVAIVESEKTAIIASVYLPKFIWLAAGTKQGLNFEKCEVLKGRKVFLFPDLKAYDVWTSKAKELSHITNFIVSDLLERKGTETERKQGLDLADYLIKFDYRVFNATNEQPAKAILPAITEIEPEASLMPAKPNNWNNELNELETFFNSIPLPAEPIRLNKCSTIINVSSFIESHFATLKNYNGNNIFMPHLNRLQTLKQLLKPIQ